MVLKGLSFVHVSCRSLYRKNAQMNVLFSDYDIICCSETWLSKAFPDHLVSLPGKKTFRIDRTTQGGGVCIYIDITKPGLKCMKVSSVYRPPRGDCIKCIDRLTEILSRNENLKKECCLLGDYKVDFFKRQEPNFKRFQHFFKTFGFEQLINGINRPGPRSGTCIDWIVTNSKFVSSSCISNVFISDHFAIECVKKMAREKHKIVYRTIRNDKKYNCDNFIALLKDSIAWNVFFRI